MDKDFEFLNPLADGVDKEEEAFFYGELAKIDGLTDFLRKIMSNDMKLHFICPPTQQDLTKGAFYRTRDMLKKIVEQMNKNKQ